MCTKHYQYREMDSAEKKPEQFLARRPSLEEGTTVSAHDGVDRNQVIIGQAVEKIGMGRYQVALLFSCSFGFIVDQASHVPASRKIVLGPLLTIIFSLFSFSSKDASGLDQPRYATGFQGIHTSIPYHVVRDAVWRPLCRGFGFWFARRSHRSPPGVDAITFWHCYFHHDLCFISNLGGAARVDRDLCCFRWGQLYGISLFFCHSPLDVSFLWTRL